MIQLDPEPHALARGTQRDVTWYCVGLSYPNQSEGERESDKLRIDPVEWRSSVAQQLP